MDLQETYDRLNMLGLLLREAEGEYSFYEANADEKFAIRSDRRRELEKIEEELKGSILYLAKGLHEFVDPQDTDGGKAAVDGVLKSLEYQAGDREYILQGLSIKQKPRELEGAEPVLEEYFKDIKINGEYACDLAAGLRVSNGYRKYGRWHGVPKSE